VISTVSLDSDKAPRNISFSTSDVEKDEPGRVFINITVQGCGSACSYCYVTDHRGIQVFIGKEEIADSIDWLLKDERFTAGRRGTIISFCPDTEPFKNDDSCELVLQVAERLLPLGNPVQFSTKERIPQEVIDRVEAAVADRDQVVFFLSATTVTNAARIEPHAAPIEDRLGNVERLRAAGLRSCLYIKPFIPATAKDIDRFIDLVNVYMPDAVIVGILYTSRDEEGRSHPVHQKLSSRGVDERFEEFVAKLSANTSVSLFHSAVCVNSWLLDREPSPRIWLRYPELCVSCRECGSGS
jgi:DNA repair photolyase